MNKAILGIGGLVAALTASTANAAIIPSFLDGGAATVELTPLGFTMFNDFEAGTGVTGSGFQFKTPPSDSSGAVIPNSIPFGTQYLSVLAGGSATIDLPDVAAFGFDWGSLDDYNMLTVFGYGGAFGGGGFTQFIPGVGFGDPANGNQFQPATNGLFAVGGDAGERFTKLVLTSRSNSFEVDHLMIKAPVPEPSTWAMMIVGLGMVGYAMRSRQRTKVSFA